MTAGDRFWDPLPLFHIGGIVPMLGCLGSGATFVPRRATSTPRVSLRQLQDERCTVAYPAFDLIWLAMLDHPRLRRRPTSARSGSSRASRTPERLRDLQRAHAVGGVRHLVRGDGVLEQPDARRGPTTRARRASTRSARSSRAWRCKIVDPETGEEQAPGVVGELCFRGYALLRGLLQGPRADGRWRSTPTAGSTRGDLGSLDERRPARSTRAG